MPKKSSGPRYHTFSCQNCGHPYTAYPPESGYIHAYLEPCEDDDRDPDHNRKQLYGCKNCNYRNYLYWCEGHFYTASST
jgi:hypothetical protein